MAAAICDVRFTLNSGHSLRQSECQLWAKSRLALKHQLLEARSAARSPFAMMFGSGRPVTSQGGGGDPASKAMRIGAPYIRFRSNRFGSAVRRGWTQSV